MQAGMQGRIANLLRVPSTVPSTSESHSMAACTHSPSFLLAVLYPCRAPTILLAVSGFAVTSPTYNGDVSKIREPFCNLLNIYCRRVFGPSLRFKSIHGRSVSARFLPLHPSAHSFELREVPFSLLLCL